MLATTVFHEDVFYEYFRPLRHSLLRFNIWVEHGLETFGEDLEIVRRFDQNFVWTVVDGGEGARPPDDDASLNHCSAPRKPTNICLILANTGNGEFICPASAHQRSIGPASSS